MATIQATRTEIQAMVAFAVFGAQAGAAVGKRNYRESHSGYSESPIGGRREIKQDVTANAFLVFFETDSRAVLPTLQPGEKIFQLRMWVIEEDLTIDANVPALVAGVEVEVIRKLLYPDEEYLYTRDEMLDNQLRLTQKTRWTALSSVDSLVEGPAIPSVPEFNKDVLRYTVEAILVVAP